MAKKATPKNERFKLNDTVFYKHTTIYRAMNLSEITEENKVKYGLCTWPDLSTGKGILSQKYKLSDLTKIPPISQPLGMYAH